MPARVPGGAAVVDVVRPAHPSWQQRGARRRRQRQMRHRRLRAGAAGGRRCEHPSSGTAALCAWLVRALWICNQHPLTVRQVLRRSACHDQKSHLLCCSIPAVSLVMMSCGAGCGRTERRCCAAPRCCTWRSARPCMAPENASGWLGVSGRPAPADVGRRWAAAGAHRQRAAAAQLH